MGSARQLPDARFDLCGQYVRLESIEGNAYAKKDLVKRAVLLAKLRGCVVVRGRCAHWKIEFLGVDGGIGGERRARFLSDDDFVVAEWYERLVPNAFSDRSVTDCRHYDEH